MAYAFLSLICKGGDESVLRSIIDRSITEIDVPEGVKSLGSTAFANCTKLARISIPDSVTNIGSSVFQSAIITDLVIPLGCTKVQGFSFANMPKLERIKLGNVTRVHTQAFSNNTLCLTYDFTRCTAVPQLDNIDAFTKINADAKILVPTSLYSDWITATNWASFLKYIWVPDSEGLEFRLREDVEGEYQVSGIGDCTDSVVVIPSKYEGLPVTRVSAVSGSLITELFFPDSVTWINAMSIDKDFNPNLEKAVFGAGLTRIDRLRLGNNPKCSVYDFSRCKQIPQLNLGGSTGDLENTPEGCRIIVPAGLLDAWKTDTNWSVYADYIAAAN